MSDLYINIQISVRNLYMYPFFLQNYVTAKSINSINSNRNGVGLGIKSSFWRFCYEINDILAIHNHILQEHIRISG